MVSLSNTSISEAVRCTFWLKIEVNIASSVQAVLMEW